MGDLTFDDWIKTRAICLFLNPSSIDDQVIIYMRQAWEEAVKQEREAILAAIDDLEEPAWYGYENPNNFDDGKRACAAAIRARSG